MKSFDDLKVELKNCVLLARGGQKTAFCAEHPTLGAVVIKLYFDDNSRSQREIEIARDFKLNFVPHTYEAGHLLYEGKKTLYTIEQKIEGTVLREHLNQGKRFNLKDAVSFVESGLLFIAQIADKKIVHRDIKPENIIITDDLSVFFLDFGIARKLDMPSLTRSSAIIGPNTPGYAAPEQFNNLKDTIDERADIFSLGVVTYECITGENPFRVGAVSALDILHKTETVTPVDHVINGDTQRQFMAFLSALMAKYPSRRPKSAQQALAWLNIAKQTFQM